MVQDDANRMLVRLTGSGDCFGDGLLFFTIEGDAVTSCFCLFAGLVSRVLLDDAAAAAAGGGLCCTALIIAPSPALVRADARADESDPERSGIPAR